MRETPADVRPFIQKKIQNRERERERERETAPISTGQLGQQKSDCRIYLSAAPVKTLVLYCWLFHQITPISQQYGITRVTET